MTPPQRRLRSVLVRTGPATGVGAGVAGRSPDGGRPHGQPAWAATPGPLGPETLTSRCGLVVLVNQAAEPVPPPDSTGERGSTSAGLAVDTPRRAKRQASVRSLVVVVAHILGEHPLRWRRPQTSTQSRHSSRTVRTQRSANALAFGACTGVVMTRMPSAANTSSKARVNLLSRSRIRN
jgi:hypothetical protein